MEKKLGNRNRSYSYCKWYAFHGANCEAPVTRIAGTAQYLMTIHYLLQLDITSQRTK